MFSARYIAGGALFHQVDDQHPQRFARRVGALIPLADRLDHEISCPEGLALTALLVGSRAGCPEHIAKPRGRVRCTGRTAPGAMSKDGYHHRAVLARESDRLPCRVAGCRQGGRTDQMAHSAASENIAGNDLRSILPSALREIAMFGAPAVGAAGSG
jgi:hypothetical protein